MAVLLASAARTESGVQVFTQDMSMYHSALLEFACTAADTEAGDTLDVYVQHSIDGGTTWDDFIHFTQVIGTTSVPFRRMVAWADTPAESELWTAQDAAMSVGVLQGPKGPKWRVKWVIVDVATLENVSFTFGVTILPKRSPA